MAHQIEPENQKYMNDLGWSLFEAGEIDEARAVLQRATEMDPEDELAAGSLRICTAAAGQHTEKRMAR